MAGSGIEKIAPQLGQQVIAQSGAMAGASR